MKSFLACLLGFTFLPVVQGEYLFCTQLVNETWAGFVQAIEDSSRIAVLCPFRISGDGCPVTEEYPEGLVVGRGSHEIMIIECEPDLNDRYHDTNSTHHTQCVIDCPGRHFTVGSSSTGLILTNMVLSGATNSSIHVETNGRLEVVNGLFERNAAGNYNAGAIEAHTGSQVSVKFSNFRNNQGFLGGAIHGIGSSLTVKLSRFMANRASQVGGAVSIGPGSIGDIEDSLFTWNEASDGGAVYVAELGAAEISRAVFTNNIALGFGGAIHVGGMANIDGSSFKDNTGIEGGGAVNTDVAAELSLLQNEFINNLSTGYGPAVYDRYNGGVLDGGNTACGNTVITDGPLALNGNLQCNGLYTAVGQNRLRRCQAFQIECVEPPNSPSVAPAVNPQLHSSVVPPNEPITSKEPTPPASSLERSQSP